MKFFVPAAKDQEMATHVVSAAKKFAKETLKWDSTNQKVFRIEYIHDGKEYSAEFGKQDPRTGELVIAILESMAYLVCMPNRGIIRDEPMLVGKDEIRKVEVFED